MSAMLYYLTTLAKILHPNKEEAFKKYQSFEQIVISLHRQQLFDGNQDRPLFHQKAYWRTL